MKSSLKQFKMSTILFNNVDPHGPLIFIIGRKDTGKTSLVRDLLFFHQDIPIGTIITGNNCYSDIVPESFIENNYTNKFLIRQQMAIRQKTITDPRAFVILDDCFYDDKWTRDDSVRRLFMNGECLP